MNMYILKPEKKAEYHKNYLERMAARKEAHQCTRCGLQLETEYVFVTCEGCRQKVKDKYEVRGTGERKVSAAELEDDVNARYKARLRKYGAPEEIVERVRC